MTAFVRITGVSDVHEILAPYTAPRLPKRMQAVTKAGANVFKAPLKAEARKVSKRMARAVSVRTASRDKPASIVTFRPKVAFFRHFVIGGTKDHGPRRAKALVFEGPDGLVVARRVRGVPANPMVDRVFGAYQNAAGAAMDKAIDQQT